VPDGLRRVGGGVLEDDFVALIAELADQVLGRLDLHAVHQSPVLVLDSGEVDRRPGVVVGTHEPEDERPAQRFLNVLGQKRAPPPSRALALPDSDLLGAFGIPTRHAADDDIRFREPRVPQPPHADRLRLDVEHHRDVSHAEHHLHHVPTAWLFVEAHLQSSARRRFVNRLLQTGVDVIRRAGRLRRRPR
jgi:hypothetical protein